MANTKAKKLTATENELIGAQVQPTTLDRNTRLDVDTSKNLIDNIIEAGLHSSLNTSELDNFTSVSNSREQIYNIIDTMAADSTIASIIKTYAEDVCEPSDSGKIVWAESDDPKISAFINYLLNVMKVDKHIFTWATNLIKYGDVYLRLYRESDGIDSLFDNDKINTAYTAKTQLNESADLTENINLSLHTAGDPYSYYVEMVADPSTMFELTKFGKTYGYVETPNADNNMIGFLGIQTDATSTANNLNYAGYKMKTNDVNIYQADDFVHASLEDNDTRFPETVSLFTSDEDYKTGTNAFAYTVRRGKSMIIDSYKIWREKQLLETSVLLNRLTKSSVVRNIQVEVGDMPKSKVERTLRNIKELFEQRTAINAGTSMSEYTNPGPYENNVYTATHNGQGAITVNAVGGDIDVKNIADLDWWNNKLFAAYGVPKQFFGYTDDAAGFSGGTSLSIISSTFSKGIKRVQNALVQMLTDALNLFCLNKGVRSYINNFTIKMRAPLSQEEKDFREDLTNRISAISNLQSLFADVENKSRRLRILKELISTLNYGDDILTLLDDEIAEAEAADEAAKAAAEAEAAAATATAGPDEALDQGDEDSLGNSSEIPMEAFTKDGQGTILVEEQEAPELTELILEDDVLPSPEQIDKSKDFTRNE